MSTFVCAFNSHTHDEKWKKCFRFLSNYEESPFFCVFRCEADQYISGSEGEQDIFLMLFFFVSFFNCIAITLICIHMQELVEL